MPLATALHGERGEITWNVVQTEEVVTVSGHGPGWTVSHTATEEMVPIRTVRTDAEGSTWTIDYYPWGARVNHGDHSSRYVTKDLWDTDTIDLRLATFAKSGEADADFRAIDLADGRVYRFRAHQAGEVGCGKGVCDRVKLELLGMPATVAPAWEFQYSAEGQLVKMLGTSGIFNVQVPALPVSEAPLGAPPVSAAPAPALVWPAPELTASETPSPVGN